MKVKFLTPAWIELREGSEYYEKEQSGLGNRFWKEVDQHIQWIILNSEVPRLREGHYRRVNLKVFPFYVVYIIRGEMILI